ncbi:unnamed protein product [Tenebrio molitor]|nr:unnamed protein product [Tenebrio molitor]
MRDQFNNLLRTIDVTGQGERVVWLGYGYVLNCHKQKQLKYSFFHE